MHKNYNEIKKYIEEIQTAVKTDKYRIDRIKNGREIWIYTKIM